MREIFEIKNNGMTLLVLNTERKVSEFEFAGIKIDSEPNIIYTKSTYDSFPKKLEAERKVMKDIICEVLKTQADKELNTFLTANEDSDEIYFEGVPTHVEGFNRNYTLWSRLHDMRDSYTPKINYFDYDYKDIVNGIVIVDCACGLYVHYNLKTKTFEIKTYERYTHVETDKTCLDIFYPASDRNIMLANYQLKIGKGFPLHKEIVRLNKFLDGKKSVNVVFNNDIRTTTIKTKYDSGLSANDIIDMVTENKVLLRMNNFDNSFPQGELGNLRDIKYLKHGSKKFIFEVNTLRGVK